MRYSEYKFKFYINANHAIYLNGTLGQNHPHTWEISLDTIKVSDDFIQFDFIEKEVEKYFLYFQDKNINTIDPFTAINPTLENLCEHLKKDLLDILSRNGWLLTRIEMSETPARSFIIDLSDDVDEMIDRQNRIATAEAHLKAAVQEKLTSILGSSDKK
jgi:6-pyruvoyltetrahydropterin/6-carboxytetrahydropterin synthase